MSRPSILLIPGASGLPEFYDTVVSAVAARGYEIRALHLPSVGLVAGPSREGELPTMYDDAAFIAESAAGLADEGKDVLIVTHSYGGVPATESVRGLSKGERQRQGKRGGVVRLAYISSLVPAVGKSAAEVLEQVDPQQEKIAVSIDDKGWMTHADIRKAAELSFSSLPREEGERWAKKMQLQSSASFASPLTYAGYKDVPVSYLLCEEDRIVTVDLQKAEIELIERESGRPVDVTSIKSDHCPIISAPEEVERWILGILES